jgi:hypothetical protein
VIGDFMLTTSKGFVHVTGDGGVNNLSHEFIHESVREYFLDHGLRKLDCTLGHDVVAASHDRLARHCITYILFVRIKVMATPAEETPFAALTGRSYKAVPFLNYVRQIGAFYHAEMAEHGGIRQSDFCTKFPLLKWKSLDKIGPGLSPRSMINTITQFRCSRSPSPCYTSWSIWNSNIWSRAYFRCMRRWAH